jgi:hypothetical protein
MLGTMPDKIGWEIIGKILCVVTKLYSQAGLIPKSPLARGSLWGGFKPAKSVFSAGIKPAK